MRSGLTLRGALSLLSLKAGGHLYLCWAPWGHSILFSAQADIRKTPLHYPFQSVQDEHLTAALVPVLFAGLSFLCRNCLQGLIQWSYSGRNPAASLQNQAQECFVCSYGDGGVNTSHHTHVHFQGSDLGGLRFPL